MGKMVRICLQAILKLVNSVIGMVGIGMILYSLWMLRVWYRQMNGFWSGGDDTSPPWFIYTFLGLGISLCVITCSGHIAAETANGHCLSCHMRTVLTWRMMIPHSTSDQGYPSSQYVNVLHFFVDHLLHLGFLKYSPSYQPVYSFNNLMDFEGPSLHRYMVLVFLLVMVEAAITADVFLNRNWEEDFPEDPTGRFDELKDFVKSNFEMCRWIGLMIVATQALSILLAMVLRALGPYQERDYDSDDDYIPTRLPLLRNHQNPSYVPVEPHIKNESWSIKIQDKINR